VKGNGSRYTRPTAVDFALSVVALVSGVCVGALTAQAIPIDADDIGGVVTGPTGPEAGVWVIAETTC
jgi:hypothetical protein